MKKKIGVLFAGALLALSPLVSSAKTPLTGQETFFFNGNYFQVRPYNAGINPSNDGEFLREVAAFNALSGTYDFGSPDDPDFWLDLTEIPFDAGLSVLLGAGAVTALRRARGRKKEALA